jgi:type I restriction enzyme M protein
MNMLLHGVEVPSLIRHDNTLARPLRDWGRKDRVDIVLTNPPFGGTEEPGIESNFPASFQTTETADLFLVLIMQLLKEEGRAAVVLPDGFLFGDGIKAHIKEKLLAECELHTIVRLPNGVFAPYTGIKTNLLFFTKGSPTEQIWYFEHPYPAGYKSYSKTKPITIGEFDREKAWWGSAEDGFAARVESEQAWKVSADEIKANGFNLDRKNPNRPEEALGDPDELLARYKVLAGEVKAARDELKGILRAALGGKE